MNRRQFVTTAGAASGALLLPATAKAADDTATIQKMLNMGGDVVIPAGLYDVGPLNWGPKLNSVRGTKRLRFGSTQVLATTLRLKPNAGNAARLLTPYHSGDTDRNIAISDLNIDMNRAAQGWDGMWSHAHSAAIFLGADPAKKGRLLATLRNIIISNSAGDGIYVHHATTLDMAGYNATDIHRGGFLVTGRGAVATLKNAKLTRATVDIEPNAGSHQLTVTLEKVECDNFQGGLTPGSKIIARGCKFHSSDREHHMGEVAAYFYAPAGAELLVQDTTINGRVNCRLFNGTLERCTINQPAHRPSSPVVYMSWYKSGWVKDLHAQFIDCTINGPCLAGIDAAGFYKEYNQQMTVRNLTVNNGTKAIMPGANNGHWGYRVFEGVKLNGVLLPDVKDGRPVQ